MCTRLFLMINDSMLVYSSQNLFTCSHSLLVQTPKNPWLCLSSTARWRRSTWRCKRRLPCWSRESKCSCPLSCMFLSHGNQTFPQKKISKDVPWSTKGQFSELTLLYWTIAGRSSLLSSTKTRRTSRTLHVWCKSTRSCWTRTRVCPCTTRTAKNNWNSSECSNRRDRAHPDPAETGLNCPRPFSPTLFRHTNTNLLHLQHTHTHTYIHIFLAFCCLACWLIDMCPPCPCWHSNLFLQTKQLAQPPWCPQACLHPESPGDEAAGWDVCCSEWQENNLRTFGVPAPFVCVSVKDCLCLCPCVCVRVHVCVWAPSLQISLFMCSRMHKPLLTPPLFSVLLNLQTPMAFLWSISLLGFFFFVLVFFSVVVFLQ